MNPRIKDLAEQATRRYDRLGFEIPFAQPDLEQFAQLIIYECMQCCTKVDDDEYDGITPDCITGIRDGALLCKEEIKTHFGIE